MLQKDTLIDGEQEKLNYHTASIHHELTHLKHNDGLYTHIYENIIAIPTSFVLIYGLNRILTTKFPLLSTNYIINNIAKIIRAVAIIECTRYIAKMNLYSKYKEQRADDEIPNEEALLKAMLIAYQQYHQKDLEQISNIKSISWKDVFNHTKQQASLISIFCNIATMKIIPINWFNNPLIMNFLYKSAEHPSHIHRALRFKKRIEILESRTN